MLVCRWWLVMKRLVGRRKILFGEFGRLTALFIGPSNCGQMILHLESSRSLGGESASSHYMGDSEVDSLDSSVLLNVHIRYIPIG